jgi:MtN3 and saliva related transmembrane protein
MSSSVGVKKTRMKQFSPVALGALFLAAISLTGCQQLTIDTDKLFKHDVELSEIVGLLAGFGTTFAAFPDLLAMLKRRSSLGMNPRMGAITGAFQILWIYYGLLIGSRPVIIWNVVAVVINFLTVGAYAYFFRKERQAHAAPAKTSTAA